MFELFWVWSYLDNNTLVDVLVFFLSWYLEILEFCHTTLNKKLVIGKFSFTIQMFVSFPLWVFGLEVWNDRHVLGVGFGEWQIEYHFFLFFIFILKSHPLKTMSTMYLMLVIIVWTSQLYLPKLSYNWIYNNLVSPKLVYMLGRVKLFMNVWIKFST